MSEHCDLLRLFRADDTRFHSAAALCLVPLAAVAGPFPVDAVLPACGLALHTVRLVTDLRVQFEESAALGGLGRTHAVSAEQIREKVGRGEE